MDAPADTLRADTGGEQAELELLKPCAEVPSGLSPVKFWHDERKLKVLGTGTALPGPPVPTSELLTRIQDRFGVSISRRGTALANRLKIATRHICRDFESRHETPRAGHSNPELAAAALSAAVEQAHLRVADLDYIIGHTASPARLVPPNIA